eukprot:scaffold217979_cov64-Attheya_sp.AAC.1
MTWDDAVIPMPEHGTVHNKNEVNLMYDDISEPTTIKEAAQRSECILDTKYKKADLTECIQECTNLSAENKNSLYTNYCSNMKLFDGTLGTWNAPPVDFKLKPNAVPYHARAFPVPQSLLQHVKIECERLCHLNVLRKVGIREWAAPSFIKPKKNKTVCFLTDFRELNKSLEREEFPLPNIQDLLQKIEGFNFATSLDLNMGYYTIRLTPNASRLCTIVFPWGQYEEYLRLPMGVHNSPGIFQHQMSSLMAGLEFVRSYLDDIL